LWVKGKKGIGRQMQSHSGIITLSRLCKLLDVDGADDYTEFQYRNFDLCPEYTEEEVSREIEAATNKYIRAVLSVSQRLFGEHGLLLVIMKGRGYRILPQENWKVACQKLIETINGVGYFHFSSIKELKDSGPYATYRQAALNHIGWIADRSRVYEGTNASYLVERELR
jgi:hypothetical protein